MTVIAAARKKIASIDFNATSAEAWSQIRENADTILSDLATAYKDTLGAIQEAPKEPKK